MQGVIYNENSRKVNELFSLSAVKFQRPYRAAVTCQQCSPMFSTVPVKNRTTATENGFHRSVVTARQNTVSSIIPSVSSVPSVASVPYV